MLGFEREVQYLVAGVTMSALLLNPHFACAVTEGAPQTTLKPLALSPQGVDLPAGHRGVRDFVKKLRGQNGSYLRVNPETGSVATILGQFPAVTRGTPENVAVAFLASQLGLPTGGATAKTGTAVHTLVPSRTLESKGTHHVEFVHQVNGVPVDGEEVRVHVADSGDVVGMTGTYHPAAVATETATVDATEAIRIAQQSLSVSAVRAAATSRKAYVTVEGQLTLAHIVPIPAEQPLGDFEVVVSAASGKLLGGENLLCSANGEGKVYIHSPVQGEPQTVQLKYLDNSKGLVGSYANIVNGKGAGALADDRKYNYAPDNTHFDEVMMYYHINRCHDYFNFLGYHDRDKPIKCTVHYGTDYDNAFFSPMSDSLAFGDGKKLNNLSKEDNVAYHEYTHAVSRTIVNLRGEEGGAMNEGYSDYFAGSMNNDSKIGVWVMKKLNRPFMRDMNNKKHYPEDIGHEVHKDGEIWGGVCWDLRKELGANLSDMIIHKSRYNLGSTTNFKTGLDGCLAADRQLNGGANAAKITSIFNARGIKSASFRGGPDLTLLTRQFAFGELFGEE
jgi:Zn-dependent metalloprotease